MARSDRGGAVIPVHLGSPNLFCTVMCFLFAFLPGKNYYLFVGLMKRPRLNERTDTMATFTCHNCGATKTIQGSSGGGTGYAVVGDVNQFRICYACCAIGDALTMEAEGKIALYFDGAKISNWPGSLTFVPMSVSEGRHNIARTQTTVHFRAFGRNWTGRQYGSMSQLLRCKAVR